MSGLGTWLAEMMKPLVARVMTALGFTVVTIEGVTASLDGLKTMLVANMQTVPSAGLQLAMLAGAGTAMGLILGAVTFRMLLWQIAKTTRILGGGGGS